MQHTQKKTRQTSRFNHTPDLACTERVPTFCVALGHWWVSVSSCYRTCIAFLICANEVILIYIAGSVKFIDCTKVRLSQENWNKNQKIKNTKIQISKNPNIQLIQKSQNQNSKIKIKINKKSKPSKIEKNQKSWIRKLKIWKNQKSKTQYATVWFGLINELNQ